MKNASERKLIYTGEKFSKWETLKQQGSDHYKTGGVEPVDLYKAGGMFVYFALCSIIKYAFRSRDLVKSDSGLFMNNMDKIIDYAQKLKAYASEKGDK
jgi:hypothetical protein